MNNIIKIITLTVIMFFLKINNNYAQETNTVSSLPKDNIQSNKTENKNWGLSLHLGFGPTLSSFANKLNKNMDDYFPNKGFGKQKRKNFKINNGLSFAFDIIISYKTLDWLENQIYIKFNNSEIYTGSNDYRYKDFSERKDNYFKGTNSRTFGTNALFYINKNFFALSGIGINLNIDEKILNIIPIFSLGIGLRTDVGLIFRLKTNLTFDIFSLKDDYIGALQKAEKFEPIDKETLKDLNLAFSLDIIEICIGYDLTELLSNLVSYAGI